MRLRGGSGSETSTPSTPQRLIEGIMDAAAPPTPTLFKRLASEYDSRCILKEAAVFFSKTVGDTVRSAPASPQASQGFIRLVAERLNSMDDVEFTTNVDVLIRLVDSFESALSNLPGLSRELLDSPLSYLQSAVRRVRLQVGAPASIKESLE